MSEIRVLLDSTGKRHRKPTFTGSAAVDLRSCRRARSSAPRTSGSLAALLIVALFACGGDDSRGDTGVNTRQAALAEGSRRQHRMDADLIDERLAGLLGEGIGIDPAREVVVIVLDTLRRDRVGVYGRPGRTPNLDAWASEARIFSRARSVASWTLPAHASLFTGRYPISHGARSSPLGSGRNFEALPPGTPTLAGALSSAGYVTAGIAANKGFLSRSTGIHQGFDLWLCDDIVTVGAYPTAQRVTEMALHVLEKPRARPLFLFLNYLDVHPPMVVHEEFLERPGELQPQHLPGTPEFRAREHALLARGEVPPDGFFDSWKQAYDAELRYLDSQLGRLFAAFPRLGIGDEDLVLVLSDHGELFGEHGLVSHWRSLHEELIAIPLLVRGPGFAPGRDDRPVQIQDLPAWILDFTGAPRLPGMQLTEGIQVAELYWTRLFELFDPEIRGRFDRIQRAYVLGDHKLIIGDDGTRELYHLASDPREQRRLPESEWSRELDARARAWLESKERGQGVIAAPSAEMMRALEALGYVESKHADTTDERAVEDRSNPQ